MLEKEIIEKFKKFIESRKAYHNTIGTSIEKMNLISKTNRDNIYGYINDYIIDFVINEYKTQVLRNKIFVKKIRYLISIIIFVVFILIVL